MKLAVFETKGPSGSSVSHLLLDTLCLALWPRGGVLLRLPPPPHLPPPSLSLGDELLPEGLLPRNQQQHQAAEQVPYVWHYRAQQIVRRTVNKWFIIYFFIYIKCPGL